MNNDAAKLYVSFMLAYTRLLFAPWQAMADKKTKLTLVPKSGAE